MPKNAAQLKFFIKSYGYFPVIIPFLKSRNNPAIKLIAANIYIKGSGRNIANEFMVKRTETAIFTPVFILPCISFKRLIMFEIKTNKQKIKIKIYQIFNKIDIFEKSLPKLKASFAVSIFDNKDQVAGIVASTLIMLV